MKKYDDFWERLAARTDLQDEAMPKQPIVEILGEKRILIEHHLGVTEYSMERIKLKANFGDICICGAKLHLAKMCRDQLVITGRIDSVTICRR